MRKLFPVLTLGAPSGSWLHTNAYPVARDPHTVPTAPDPNALR
jgi:hypothetical protein